MNECLHCKTAFIRSTSKAQFCCLGCEHIHNLSLKYDFKSYVNIIQQNQTTTKSLKSNYRLLDSPEFLTEYQIIHAEQKQYAFYIEGIECGACVLLFRRMQQEFQQDYNFELSLNTNTISISCSIEQKIAPIIEYIESFSYKLHFVANQQAAQQYLKKEKRNKLIRIGISAAMASNIMILSAAVYTGADSSISTYLNYLQAILFLPVLLFAAPSFFKNATQAIKQKQMHLDIPISLAILFGSFISYFALFTKNDKIYFDSLASLIFLILSSRYVFQEFQNKIKNSLQHIHPQNLLSLKRLNEQQIYTETLSQNLKVGDKILVNENIELPVDAKIIEGELLVDTAIMDGESQAKGFTVGNQLYSGYRILKGHALLEISKEAKNSLKANIENSLQTNLQKVEEKSQTYASYSIYLALFFCVLSIPMYWPNLFKNIEILLCILLVSCPCAYAFAMPLNFQMFMSYFHRKNIIFKNISALEKLNEVQHIIFDKTGTLTNADFKFVERISYVTHSYDSLIYSLESLSLHPISYAFEKYFKNNKTEKEKSIFLPQTIKASASEDLIKIEQNNHSIGLLWKKNKLLLRAMQTNELRKIADLNHAILANYVGFYINDELADIFIFSDSIKQNLKSSIDQLKKNYKISILSGDNEQSTRQLANAIGISDYKWGLKPEEKAILCKDLKNTIFIGDGSNDALAMQNCMLSASVHKSSYINLNQSQIYFGSNNMQDLVDSFKLAKKFAASQKRNYAINFIYNASAMSLALFSMLNPLMAAFVMPISSLTVYLHTYYSYKLATKNNTNKIQKPIEKWSEATV